MRNMSLRCSLRRIRLRKAICYKKKKKRENFDYFNRIDLLLIKPVRLIELFHEWFP